MRILVIEKPDLAVGRTHRGVSGVMGASRRLRA